jgi:type I restriction enzyme S subunit
MGADYEQYPFQKGKHPAGWIETTVGEVILEIRSGFSSGKHNQAGHGIPHLRPMNVSPHGEISMEDVRYVAPGVGSLRLAKDDVLFTNTSSTLWVGKTALVEQPADWGFSNHMTRLRVAYGMSPEFVARQLHYLCLSGYFAFHCKKHINQSSIAGNKLAGEVPFRLPPAAEQARITAKLRQLLTRQSKLHQQLEQLTALIQQYRTAVLEAACTGRLVPTDSELARKHSRKYETVRELLDRTPLPPRPNRYASRNKEVLDVGHPVLCVGNPDRRLPEGWHWTPLVDIARMETGHTPSRSHPEWWIGEVPWLGIADARENHGQIISDTVQHTTETGLENSAARLLPPGTVCVSRTASVGYVVVMGRAMATSQDFVNLSPTPAVLSGWLKIAFMANRDKLLRFGKGAIHTTIYFSEWLSMHIALPPLQEQQRIVKEAEHQLTAIARIGSGLRSVFEQTAKLRGSIFHRALSGKLVSQSEIDEPASILLERITRGRAHRIKQQKKEPKSPMKKKTPSSKLPRDLLEILNGHENGLTPEQLMYEAGYNSGEVPAFYKALRHIEKQVQEIRPERKIVILKRRRS